MPNGPLWKEVKHLLHESISNWQGWEMFCCRCEIIRAFLLYLDRSEESGPSDPILVPLCEFFPTSLRSPDLGIIEMHIKSPPNLIFARALQRWPENSPKTVDGKIEIQEGTLVLNAEGASCDWFSQRLIKPVTIGKKERNKVYLCGQGKFTQGQTLLTLAEIVKERKKIDKFKGKPDELSVLCIITNRQLHNDVTADKLPRYTLVIDPSNHRDYFGAIDPGAINNIMTDLGI